MRRPAIPAIPAAPAAPAIPAAPNCGAPAARPRVAISNVREEAARW